MVNGKKEIRITNKVLGTNVTGWLNWYSVYYYVTFLLCGKDATLKQWARHAKEGKEVADWAQRAAIGEMRDTEKYTIEIV